MKMMSKIKATGIASLPLERKLAFVEVLDRLVEVFWVASLRRLSVRPMWWSDSVNINEFTYSLHPCLQTFRLSL
jgi:hypothetical protein